MHQTQSNLIEIQNKIKKKINEFSLDKYDPKIIAVSKTFSEQEILPLNYNFQEAKNGKILNKKYDHVRLHMLGKLQTNKVKNAVEIFDYIHSLDNLKLANKLAKQIHEKNKKIKIFIQINLGGEKQKSGIDPSNLEVFYKNCLDLKLNIIGTMCIPPDNQDPKPFFKEMLNLNNKFNLPEISMGMTNDFLEAVEFKSTYLRIGTGIFGKRSI